MSSLTARFVARIFFFVSFFLPATLALQLDLENNGCFALRELQRKQEQELDDDNNPSSIEIRRRIVQMVHEMARDGVI